jgi:hypothetical protein
VVTELAARSAISEEYTERRGVRCTERKAELRRGARRLIIRPAGISGARRG